MNGTEHTPGPWIRSRYGFQVLTQDEMNVICDLSGRDPEIVQIANANLLAAAPDLLAVCEELFHFLIHELYDDRKMAQELTKTLGDTIDKARGA